MIVQAIVNSFSFSTVKNLPVMETVAFTPNEKEIEERAAITPFGRAAMYETALPEIVEFILDIVDSEVPAGQQLTSDFTTASEVYVAPTFNQEKLRPLITTQVTVRVSNIPLQLSHRDVYDTFMTNCGLCFLKVNLVSDKETRQSKGVAYVTCETQEKAAEFAKLASNIVIDSFKFGVEILSNR